MMCGGLSSYDEKGNNGRSIQIYLFLERGRPGREQPR